MNRLLLSAVLWVGVAASTQGQIPQEDVPPAVATSPNPAVPAPNPEVASNAGEAPTEPTLPEWSDTRHNSQSADGDPQGYYPTSADLLLLGDYDYRRSSSYTQLGPDAQQQRAMDIFEYESGPQDFFTRNEDILQPVDQILGWFTPHKTFTSEFGRTAQGSVLVDGNFPIFTRTLSSDQAHLKAGPLAFDLLWLGTGVIWSDFNGTQEFPEGDEDGWIGFIEIGARGYLQVTESLHLSWLANVIYLPWENELALNNGYSSNPNLSADLVYQFRLAKWDFILFDRFYARPGIDIFAELDEQGVDQAGRYRFGYYERIDSVPFFEENNVWFVNQAGFEANRMFFDTDWRFRSQFSHWDFFRTFEFDDHTTRDTLQAQLGYEGNVIPFAPSISYMGSTYDGFESFVHRIQGTLTGRITQNIRARVMGGYLWTDNFDVETQRALWNGAIMHDFSKYGQHSLSVGQTIVEDPFSPESVLTQFVRYNISYRLTQRLQAAAYLQHSDGERLSPPSSTTGDLDSDFNFYGGGVTLSYRPLDFTNIVARAGYQNTDPGEDTEGLERWLYRLQVMQRLASRLVFETFYQFEDVEGAASDFDEHAVGASLRWFF